MTYVFTVAGDKHVTRHKVEIGRRADGRVEIVSGLETGMTVVESGGAFLSDGSLVTIAPTEEAAR